VGNFFGKFFKKKTADLKDIKIIFSDIDGTLYTRRGELRPKTIELIKQLQKAGVTFVLATGREYQVAEEILEQLDFQTPVIALDGAMVRDGKTGNILYTSPLATERIDALAHELEKYKVSYTILTPDGNLYNTEPELPSHLQHPNAKSLKIDVFPNKNKNILRIFFTGNRAFITSLYDVMKKKLGFHEKDISTYESKRESGKFYIEVKPHTSHKGAAAEHMLKHYGFKSSEAAAVGDYRNDIELLKVCGYKVAMSDAVAELREIADLITKETCDEGGIDEFFEMVLDAKRNGVSR
jgi:Cof subfamily protein (haloacid dehalogenase superfamily)